MLVVPKEAADSLLAVGEGRRRIRGDFWHAFVTFPRLGEVRAYVRETDRIATDTDKTKIPNGGIRITPISKEIQLTWRKEFVSGQVALAGLELKPETGFRSFAQAIAIEPEVRRKWNDVWFREVSRVIRDWGEVNEILEETWLVPEKERGGAQDRRRRELYEILDRIPVERLLELTVPLAWLIPKKK